MTKKTYSLEEVEKSFLKAFPFPTILFKVVSMVKEGKDSLYKLGQEISKDPVLSARTISLANSPYYGTKQKISDLPHAISLLGTDDVARLVMHFASEGVFSSMKASRSSQLYSPRHIWQHSVKVALINRILVRHHNMPFGLESYLAGLMHDIGKSAIGICIDQEDEKTIRVGMHKGEELFRMEQEVLGFDHAQCSFEILKKMNVSLDVLKMVRRHHEPMEKDYRMRSFNLALANVLATCEDPEDSTAIADLDRRLTAQFKMRTSDVPDLLSIYRELNIDMEFI